MSSNKLIVAAIDFGTTFSGYAFSFQHDYQKDPTKIQTNQWIGGGHISLKAPTCVLFHPNKVFHSFGYEAEDFYTELADDDKHQDWFYFRRFKMLLHNNTVLSRSTLLHDEQKKTMEAVTVFAACIKFMKGHLVETINKRLADLDADKDIHWVLTIPAIWNDSAKQFMRLAATTAGIDGSRLSLALEPEAASFLCKSLPIEKLTSSGNLDIFRSGTCYIVLDLGGGTVDITVHQVQADGSLVEVTKASGGAWGGTRVDKEYTDFLISIVSEPVFASHQRQYTGDHLEILREFEVKKRSITADKTGMINVRMPASFMQHYKSKTGRAIADRLKEMPDYDGKVVFMRDKVRIDAQVFKGFFEKPIANTIKHVQDILVGNEFRGISNMLLVGGFAESDIIQARIRRAFSSLRIVTPGESGLVVLKGAVIFGHNPKIVQSRVSKYTYGTEVINRFIPGVHPEKYKVFEPSAGCYKCRYLFEPFVRAGEDIPVDGVVSKIFFSDSFDVAEGVGIYASTSPNPKYVTDPGCFKLGAIVLEVAGHETLNEMQFGGTEFTMQITDKETGVKRVNCFDFLSH